MKDVVLNGSSMLPHSCSCGVVSWGRCCLLDSLNGGGGGRIVEHALGTVVPS